MNTHEHMADHWWWRPGWRAGRRFYTWHVTFQNATEVHRLAAAYRQGLAAVPGLDLVPDQWLHLTTQGLGFTDEVPAKDIRAIVDAAALRLRAQPAFELTLHRPEITPEAIRWEAAPAQPATTVRRQLRAAITDVWPEAPEPAGGFAPHVSIAYSNTTGPAQPAAEALAHVQAAPVTTRVTSVELIVLHRDRHMYEWDPYASIPLLG